MFCICDVSWVKAKRGGRSKNSINILQQDSNRNLLHRALHTNNDHGVLYPKSNGPPRVRATLPKLLLLSIHRRNKQTLLTGKQFRHHGKNLIRRQLRMRGPMNTISGMNSHVLRCNLGAYHLSCMYVQNMYVVEAVGNDGWHHEDIWSCHRQYIHAQAYDILLSCPFFFKKKKIYIWRVFIWQ